MPQHPDIPETKLLTAQELADVLRISIRTIRTLVSENKLPHVKVGSSYRFDEKKVIDALSKEV